jgi:hypothetical protein
VVANLNFFYDISLFDNLEAICTVNSLLTTRFRGARIARLTQHMTGSDSLIVLEGGAAVTDCSDIS